MSDYTLSQEDLDRLSMFEKDHQMISRIANMLKKTFGSSKTLTDIDFREYMNSDGSLVVRLAWNFYNIEEQELIIKMLIRQGVLVVESTNE